MKKNVIFIFIFKKIITLTSIQKMNNGRQKIFGNKIKNFVKIKVNTMNFWQIIKKF